MLKKVLIGVGVLLVLLGGGVWYLNHQNRTLSPPGSVSITNGDLTVNMEYSRPSVRDRVIFGSEADGALQPYGKYWRLGANEATEIEFNRDIKFMGNPVKKGRYRIYAVPGPEEFDIVLNTALGEWGYNEADHTLDLLSVKAPVTFVDEPTEQYTINMEKNGQGILVHFDWDIVRVTVPIE